MKNKQKTQLLLLTVVVLVAAVGYMFYNPQVVEVPVEVAVPVPVRPVPTRRGHTQEPEFRGPPIKQYKPGHMQQMGLITNGDETLPLYGKEVRGRRDRYNYYTPPEVKIFTQCQSPTMRGTAWKTLGAKSYTEMKQSP